MAAIASALMLPALAVKVIEEPPEGTLVVAGTVSAVLLLDKAIAAPFDGAGCVSERVQMLLAKDPRLEGLQMTDETSTEAARFTVIFAELPL